MEFIRSPPTSIRFCPCGNIAIPVRVDDPCCASDMEKFTFPPDVGEYDCTAKLTDVPAGGVYRGIDYTGEIFQLDNALYSVPLNSYSAIT